MRGEKKNYEIKLIKINLFVISYTTAEYLVLFIVSGFN